MEDKLRLRKLARLSKKDNKQVKYYAQKGCFVFCFSHKGKQLQATICSEQGIICGVYNTETCRTEDIALLAQVIDNKLS